MGVTFQDRLASRGTLVLDGGLATELERRGFDLDHTLWSAAVLDSDPDAIAAVHLDYLRAGADVITTSGYQASVPGFRAAGFDAERSEELFRRSIRVAFEARDAFCAERGIDANGVDVPLVAASIGPYGAYLADGSEYRGDYDATPEEVRRFHADRLELTLDEMRRHVDRPLLAIETIPSLPEAQSLVVLVDNHDDVDAWLSLSCTRDDATAEGQSIEDCVAALDGRPGLVAIGVNCTDVGRVGALLAHFRGAGLPLIAYPNAGGTWDADAKEWRGDGRGPSEAELEAWVGAGARALGGCCRTTPEWIAELAAWRDRRGGR